MVLKHTKTPNLLDGTTNAPMSVQIARFLINEIKNGVYKPGQKLESIRTLAERLGVGRQIVLSAFEILTKHNYIYSAIGRSGTFVNPALKPGLFYRMGLFINRNNPARYGYLINSVFEEAAKNSWQLVIGHNFEENLELSAWAQSKKDLDGVVITGIVDESVLKDFKELCIPYLVLGNYELATEHPQIGVDFYPLLKTPVSEILKSRNIGNMAVLLGPELQRNERELASAMNKISSDCGLKECRIVHSSDGGFIDICRIMKGEKIDAFFFYGEQALAWRKYQLNNEISGKRPLIIINKKWTSVLDEKFYDIVFDVSPDIEKAAVRRMINIIEGRDGAV